jgi:hypothetical protein
LSDISSTSLLLVFITMELLSIWEVIFPHFFHISCVPVLEFSHLKTCFWLKVLINFSLLVEIFSVIRQDDTVAKKGAISYHLDLEYGSVPRHSPIWSGHCNSSTRAQIEEN